MLDKFTYAQLTWHKLRERQKLMQSEIANPEMQEGSQTDFASKQVPNPGDFSV